MSIDELIARYDRYTWCEEYHFHGKPDDEESHPLEEHKNFDREAFKQALEAELLSLLPRKYTEAEIEKMGQFSEVKALQHNRTVDQMEQSIKDMFRETK